MTRLSTDVSSSEPPHPAVDFWPRFLLFPFLAVVAYPPFILGWGGDHWAVTAAWVAFLTYCWFCVAGSFHEAAHQTLFRKPAVNVWVGRMLGMMIGIPYSAYRETHRRHHAYLNTQADYELWPYSDPRQPLWFRRVFVWIDLIGGVVTAPYIYGRIFWKRDPRLSDAVRRTIAWEYATMAAVWGGGVALLVLWTAHVGWSWRNFNAVWLLPLLLSPVLNTGRKFVEHLGMTSLDPVLGTRTIVGGNRVSRLLSYFNFDIAIHGPHHRYPRAQHYELAQRLDDYRQKHPEEKVPVFASYFAAIADLIPCLWNNPATGTRQPVGESLQPSESTAEIDWEPAETASAAVSPIPRKKAG